MQTLTNLYPDKDYRFIFGFMLYYPILKHKDYPLSRVFNDLYAQGLVPLRVITDREDPLFKRLKANSSPILYKTTDVIVLPVGFNFEIKS